MAHALFVCLHNAGRSQMSQALLERAAGGRHTAASAGTQPGERVHPQVVDSMREFNIDLAHRTPEALTHELAEQADVVVTMGCGDECPYIPASARDNRGCERDRGLVGRGRADADRARWRRARDLRPPARSGILDDTAARLPELLLRLG